MLKPKTGICIDCPPGSPVRYLVAGRCNTHYWAHRRQVSSKRTKERGPAKDDGSLGIWFEYHNTNNAWICENCGAPLNPFNPQVASSCQAHIVPKEHFKSVRGCLDNHMTLGGLHQKCYCHSTYDSSWEKAQGMNVFTLATERFLKFKHLLLPQEVKKLPAVFYDLM